MLLSLAAGCSDSAESDEDDASESDTGGSGNTDDVGAGRSDAGPLDNIDTPEDEILIDDNQPARCGDGTIDEGEACDDGNEENGDGCPSDCGEIEDGFVCRVAGGDCERTRVCGDGRQTSDEECDDGNTDSDDGCNDNCRLEKDYACPSPGEACVSVVECGDGLLHGAETCDDGNNTDNDGCDASCEVEVGWTCPSAGSACRATCGDSILLGRETCDDGNADDGDGCSSNCQTESGWVCEALGEACRETVCGDGVAEGSEPCDDGDNIVVGDGCSPGCVLEPNCEEGACTSVCGDGLMLAGDAEECDDGNDVGDDGCSADCTLEDGWVCENDSDDPPESLDLPIVYRDFIHRPSSARHPDFETYSGNAETLGLVEDQLGPDGKPVYTGLCEDGSDFTDAECPYEEQTTSQADFDEWYRDADSNIANLDSLTFDLQPDGTYVFDSGNGLFPLDDLGWVAEGSETTSDDHNFGFTSELRHWFEFSGDEFLEFSGDDDVWVFIGGRLAVDIGGLHARTEGSITLDEETATQLGLEVGRVYEIALFHAERHTGESNFRLTLKGFSASATQCQAVCGDGIVTADEACDDGEDNGAGYGFCTEECELGPRCGDGQLDEDSPEECDNGTNFDTYASGEDACAPGCVRPPYCGDGLLDTGFGEDCDDGDDNDGAYGGCNEDCSLAPYCGDGVLNGDEECDDGNRKNDDTCDTECRDIRFGPAQ